MLSALRNFALTFAISALIFGIIAYFISGFVMNTMTDIGSNDPEEETLDIELSTGSVSSDSVPTEIPDEPLDINGNSFNVLFIGSDYQEVFEDSYSADSLNISGEFREHFVRKPQIDSLLLLRVDKEERKFVFCSVPTNIRVIKDGRYVELRELYSLGNENEFNQYVTAYTGIKIDYYIQLNIDEFADFVGTTTRYLGGFSYTCPYDMSYTDDGYPGENYVIDLDKGEKIDTKEEAIALLRFDEYEGNTYTRESVAVDFMMALFSQYTAKTHSLSEYLALYDELKKCSTTNITADDVRNNLDLLLSYGSFEALTVTYPGSEVRYSDSNGRKSKGLSTYYFEPDVSRAVELLG